MLPLLTVFLIIETPHVIINPTFHCLSSSSINIHCWHDIGIGEQSWPSGGLGRGIGRHPFLLPRLSLNSR